MGRSRNALYLMAFLLHIGDQGSVVAAAGGARSSSAAASVASKTAGGKKKSAPRSKTTLTTAQLNMQGGRYVALSSGVGEPVQLTLDAQLQRAAARGLRNYEAPLGSVAMISIPDGRVLVLEGRRQSEPERWQPELALRPWAPAASVFKVVTAAALVGRGVTPEERVCYHGGLRSVEASNLVANPRLDSDCQTLSFGIAKSQNAIVARLAHEHLDAETLDATARQLGFGGPLDFELPTVSSVAAIPQEPLDLARTAAGFDNSSLSALHGAYLAAIIAQEGVTPSLHVREAKAACTGARSDQRRALPASVARAVGRMMVGTTEYGTARKSFRERGGLGQVAVAGKTGSLGGWLALDDPNAVSTRQRSDPRQRHLAFSWFVGFAPAQRPTVAIAVLLGNDAAWRPRAHELARTLLDSYFRSQRSASGAARQAPSTSARRGDASSTPGGFIPRDIKVELVGAVRHVRRVAPRPAATPVEESSAALVAAR